MGSLIYTSHADFVFIWGVSLTHPVLPSFVCGEFLLHIPCCLDFFYLGSFSSTSCAGLFYRGSFSYTSRAVFIFIWGVSLTHPVLPSILYGEFLRHIPCCLGFYARCFSYTPHADFFFLSFLSGEFLLHIPCWFRFLSGEFLLHIPCWLHFYVGSFSYTSLLASFLSGLDLILSGHFLLHIPCWLYFYQVSFCYTSPAGLIFMQGISLTHPMLPSFMLAERRPNCQPPHSLHETTQTQILPL